MGDEVLAGRVGALEHRAARIEKHQDTADSRIDQLIRDLKDAQRETREYIDRRLEQSQAALSRQITDVDEHLSRQDELIQQAAHREVELVSKRFEWPSWKATLAGLLVGAAGTVLAWAALHGFRIV